MAALKTVNARLRSSTCLLESARTQLEKTCSLPTRKIMRFEGLTCPQILSTLSLVSTSRQVRIKESWFQKLHLLCPNQCELFMIVAIWLFHSTMTMEFAIGKVKL